MYAGQLCADNYAVYAEKTGYAPSAEVELSIYEGTQNIQDFALEPVFTYTPTEMLATIDGEDVYETILTLSNNGSNVISYSVEVTPGVSWLSIDPMEGGIGPEADEVLTVVFDSTGLTAGVYETVVRVSTTEPTYPFVEIPVVLTVTCTPISDLSFSFLPEAPVSGEEITFDGSASGSPVILFAWDFDDGMTGIGEVLTHTYAEVGDYTVILTGTNCAAEPLVVTGTVSVAQACEPVHDVNVTWTPTEPRAAQLVSFEATALGDEPFTFDWSFSDGFTATGSTVEHIFDAPGTYTVTVTAGNCSGASVTVDYTVTVLPMRVYLPIVWKN